MSETNSYLQDPLLLGQIIDFTVHGSTILPSAMTTAGDFGYGTLGHCLEKFRLLIFV